MLYTAYLKKLTICPFCDGADRQIIKQKSAYLTYAKAPYAPYHLLVVPKRHTQSFLSLTKTENADIAKLLHAGVQILHKLGIKNCSILVRDGMGAGKSIKHLHYHIIPNHRIGDLDIHGEQRRILTEKEITNLIKKIKK